MEKSIHLSRVSLGVLLLLLLLLSERRTKALWITPDSSALVWLSLCLSRSMYPTRCRAAFYVGFSRSGSKNGISCWRTGKNLFFNPRARERRQLWAGGVGVWRYIKPTSIYGTPHQQQQQQHGNGEKCLKSTHDDSVRRSASYLPVEPVIIMEATLSDLQKGLCCAAWNWRVCDHVWDWHWIDVLREKLKNYCFRILLPVVRIPLELKLAGLNTDNQGLCTSAKFIDFMWGMLRKKV